MCYNRIFRTRHFRATQEFFLRVFAITENYRKVTLTRTPDPLTLSDPRDGVVTLTDPQCGDFFFKTGTNIYALFYPLYMFCLGIFRYVFGNF